MSLGIETIHRRKINTSVLNGNTLVSIRHEGVINPNSTPANVGFSLDDNAGNKSSNYGAIEPNSSSEVKDQFSPRFSVTSQQDAIYLDAVKRGDTKEIRVMLRETLDNSSYQIKAKHGMPARS